MRTKTVQWIRASLAAFVTGFASSGLAALGISGAQVVGVQVAQVTPKQFLIMACSGGVVGLLAYLKQSPIPPESTGNTDPPFKT